MYQKIKIFSMSIRRDSVFHTAKIIKSTIHRFVVAHREKLGMAILAHLHSRPRPEMIRRQTHHSQRTKKYFWLKRLFPKMQRKFVLSIAPVVDPM